MLCFSWGFISPSSLLGTLWVTQADWCPNCWFVIQGPSQMVLIDISNLFPRRPQLVHSLTFQTACEEGNLSCPLSTSRVYTALCTVRCPLDSLTSRVPYLEWPADGTKVSARAAWLVCHSALGDEGGRMQFPPVVSWGYTLPPTLSARPFQAAHSAFREEAREMNTR